MMKFFSLQKTFYHGGSPIAIKNMEV